MQLTGAEFAALTDEILLNKLSASEIKQYALM